MAGQDEWVPLGDAAAAAGMAGALLRPFGGVFTRSPFEGILASGRVPVDGKLPGDFRFTAIEPWLARVGRFTMWSRLDEITVYFNLTRADERALAEQLVGRGGLIFHPGGMVTFTAVRVHRPTLDTEMAAAGFVVPARPDPIISPRANEETAPGASAVGLAEWIFARHGQPPETLADLRAAAQQDQTLGTYTRQQFNEAFAEVYATKAHRPPVTGWPLREPYATRWRKAQKDSI